jgi:hypothetical protein
MGKKKKKKAKIEEMPETATEQAMDISHLDHEVEFENPPEAESPTPEIIEEEEPKPARSSSPRYAVLRDSLEQLVKDAPSFEDVMRNPWLYMNWRTRVAQLVS